MLRGKWIKLNGDRGEGLQQAVLWHWRKKFCAPANCLWLYLGLDRYLSVWKNQSLLQKAGNHCQENNRLSRLFSLWLDLILDRVALELLLLLPGSLFFWSLSLSSLQWSCGGLISPVCSWLCSLTIWTTDCIWAVSHPDGVALTRHTWWARVPEG